MEPLRGGNLANKVPPAIQDIWNEAETKRTPAEWALRWVWNHPEVTVVLSGMNVESHIEENIRIANDSHSASLIQEELNLVKRAEKKYRELMQVGCTGCRYCMPCPSGVDIPACFRLYNDVHMYGDVFQSKISYLGRHAGILSEPSNASLCEKCGNCEDIYTQNLPIQDLLQDVVNKFEGRWLKPFVRAAKRIMALRRLGAFRRGRR